MAVATAIFRSRERSEHYELRLSLDHASALAKKGETKMKLMNLFGQKGESSEAFFTNKGESSEASFGDTKLKETTNQLPSSPIQDKNGNLTFTLKGKIYSLNVNSEEEREKVKEEVNTNSLVKYDWFKEETGEKHWVLYNTEMYEMIRDDIFYLHYKKDSNLAPVIPINASSCYKMFYECYDLIALNLSNFDTSKMTDMSWMFDNCLNLTTLDLSNFDTSNVTNMSYMFSKCQSLTSLDLSNFDTSRVTDMSYMFSYCSRLISLDLSSFDTSNVTDMSYMFKDCSGLTLLDLSNFNTSKVTIMGDMFCWCYNLTTLNISNFDTSSVTNMHNMFNGCSKLTIIYVSDKWNTDNVIESEEMFCECTNLPNFDNYKDDKIKAHYSKGGYLTLKQ